jgi:AcrR family transcriptional regulator
MGTGDEVRVGLRERKKQETRIALSWAAIRLCVERGVDNVRVEDIAAEANVSVRTLRIADELRARPAGESLWEAVANAVLAQFALGQEDNGDQSPDRRWVDGVRLMLAEPALQGEFLKANMAAQAELTAAIAERTGTDVATEVYPSLVAAAVGGAITVASDHWMRADPPVPMGTLLRDVFAQLAAGLPVPSKP